MELRTLVDTYAAALDDGDFERWASLFVAEGEFVGFPSQDESRSPAVDFRGREELVRGIAEVLDVYERTFHFVGNHICEVNGRLGTGETYCLAHHLFEENGEDMDRVLLLRYTDEYVRRPDGWRFRSRRAHTQWTELRAI
jgi:SnoaL-like domain